MKQYILDTNVIIRFLVGDNLQHQKQAKAWFLEAEKGECSMSVPAIVVAESIFVLESLYKKDRSTIREVFEVFLSQRWLSVEKRGIVLQALPHYVDGLHFVDAFLLAYAKKHTADIRTFDKELLKKSAVS